jgi:hypothetical protein
MEKETMSTRVNMHTFRCTGCGNTTDVRPDELKAWETEYLNQNSGYVHCEIEGCDDGVLVEVREFEESQLYVNLYRTEQAYGGPEEGGWWYTRGTALGSIPLPATWEYVSVGMPGDEIYALQLRVKPVHEETARSLLNLTSMHDTYNYATPTEPRIASDYPTRRPHYE